MPRLAPQIFFAAVTAVFLLANAGCKLDRRAEPPDMELRVIADSIERLMRSATDLSQPNVVRRMLALYPDRGRVISAAGGRVTTTTSPLRFGWSESEPSTFRNSSFVRILRTTCFPGLAGSVRFEKAAMICWRT